jgi:hypothetical protein
MKKISFLLFFIFCLTLISCSQKTIYTNGASIYKTGENLQGKMLLDKNASRIKIAGSCQACHGKTGNRMYNVSIRFSDLSDPAQYKVPYTDSLFFRFLDEDLKSDGTKANIGVIWKMSDRDKMDLLDYLKTL